MGAAGRFGARSQVIDWSDEEFRILQQVYPDGGAEAVRRYLPSRTANQIVYKASLYCIYRRLWR